MPNAVRRWSASLLFAAVACSGDPTAPTPAAPAPVTPTRPTPPTVPSASDTAPTLRREFRGGWIATVANIDWPSRTTLTADQQQTELRTLLQGYVATNLNAVVFHIRPAADALYASPYEPWSRYLTGTQGKDPGYDPLAFAVREAHARGLELHAWFNPFRAGNTSDTARFAATHVWNARRDLTRLYGTQLWMDPGDPAVQDRTMQVILDVVRRYDIDAVHLDDYFYPYLERNAAGAIVDFPDSATYARYNPNHLTRADWRRDNIDRFVERLYREVHAEKSWVRVGISPFGIWRPGYPAGVSGLDAYSEIYADSRLWFANGWVDYFAPQLYWAISAPQQSYPALLSWWMQQNAMHRHLWPGNASYRVNDGTSSAFGVGEMPNQVAATRAAGASGNVFYNTTSLFARGNEVSRQLVTTVYASPAVPPATPWLDATPPNAPAVVVTDAATTSSARSWIVRLSPGTGEVPRWWVVQSRIGGVWTGPILAPAESLAVAITASASSGQGTTLHLDAVAVRAADAVWNLSEPTYWRPASVVAARR